MVSDKIIKISMKSAKALITAVLLLTAVLFLRPGKETKADPGFGYAFDYRLAESVQGLPFGEFLTTINDNPLNFGGTITTKKCLFVENGTPRVGTKPVYDPVETTFCIYFPQVTINKAYADNTTLDDFIRFKNGAPISGHRFRADEAISKGTHTGLTIRVYLSKEKSVMTASTAPVEIEVFDGNEWREIVMPDGTNFNYHEIEDTSPTPSTEHAGGIIVTLDDCCVSGYVNRRLSNSRYITLHLSGGSFTGNAGHKYHEVTSWFTNMPEGVRAIVAENASDEKTTLKIIFANFDRNSLNSVTPKAECTEPIGITIPFTDILASDGKNYWENVPGGIVLSEKAAARFDIRKMSKMAEYNAPTVMASILTGTFNSAATGEKANCVGTPGMFLSEVFVPQSVYDELTAEKEQLGADKPVLKLKLVPEDDTFDLQGEDALYATCDDLAGTESVGYYSGNLIINGELIKTRKIGSGRFTVSWVFGERETALPTDKNYIFYNIKQWTPSAEDEENGGWNGGDQSTDEEENGSGSGSENGGSGGGTGNSAPTVGTTEDSDGETDIWINGKDDKKTKQYYKSLTRKLNTVLPSVSSSAKIVVSVTDTDVTSYDNAFTSGKGQKSNKAKASYKKADGAISVVAGKEEGVARIWAAAVNKENNVTTYGYFDVDIAKAPKKFTVKKLPENQEEEATAIKSVGLSKGGSVRVAVSAEEELSEGISFTAKATKNGEYISIAASDTENSDEADGNNVTSGESGKQSGTTGFTLTVQKAPAGGKVVKVPISVICDQSGKKVNFTVIVGNEVKSINGMSDALVIASAKEDKVEKNLDYKPVCTDASAKTTDKIKAFVTSELGAGSGYDAENNKFKLTAKASAASIAYKNGTFTLKVKKGTEDGTQVRVIVLATHADKTIDVFESGIITIGGQS